MHENAAGHTVAVDSRKALSTAFGITDYSPYQEHIKQDDCSGADESPLLADGAEDEIGALLRNETESGLGSVEVTFSCESAGTDGDH